MDGYCYLRYFAIAGLDIRANLATFKSYPRIRDVMWALYDQLPAGAENMLLPFPDWNGKTYHIGISSLRIPFVKLFDMYWNDYRYIGGQNLLPAGYCYLRWFKAIGVDSSTREWYARMLGAYPLVRDVLGTIRSLALDYHRFPEGRIISAEVIHVSDDDSLLSFSQLCIKYRRMNLRVGANVGIDFRSSIIPILESRGINSDQVITGILHNQIRNSDSVVCTQLMNEVADGIRDANRRRKERVVVACALTAKERANLESAFSDFRIEYSNSPKSQLHPFAAAHRMLELQKMLLFCGYDSRDTIPIGYHALVKDVGGKLPMHIKRGRRNVHCCAPILDARDASRKSCNEQELKDYMRTAKGAWFRDYCRDTEESRVLLRTVSCERKGQHCVVKAEKLIFLHSTYDMTPIEVADCFDSADAVMGYISVLFDPAMFLTNHGVIKAMGCFWYKDVDEKQITFTFHDDESLTYKHRLDSYLSLITTSAIKSSRGVLYFLETIWKNNGVRIIRVVRNVCENVPKSIMTKNIYYPDLEKKKIVTVYDLFPEGANGTVRLKFERHNFVVSERLCNLALNWALRLGVTKFTLSNVFEYCCSVNSRYVINGVDVTSPDDALEPITLYHLAMAAYMTAFVQRWKGGELLKMCTEEELRFREQCKMSTASLVSRKIGRMLLRVLTLGFYNGHDNNYIVEKNREIVESNKEFDPKDYIDVPKMKEEGVMQQQPQVTVARNLTDNQTVNCSYYRRLRAWAMCCPAVKVNIFKATTFSSFSTLVLEHQQAFVPGMMLKNSIDSEIQLKSPPNTFDFTKEELAALIADKLTQEIESDDEEEGSSESDSDVSILRLSKRRREEKKEKDQLWESFKKEKLKEKLSPEVSEGKVEPSAPPQSASSSSDVPKRKFAKKYVSNVEVSSDDEHDEVLRARVFSENVKPYHSKDFDDQPVMSQEFWNTVSEQTASQVEKPLPVVEGEGMAATVVCPPIVRLLPPDYPCFCEAKKTCVFPPLIDAYCNVKHDETIVMKAYGDGNCLLHSVIGAMGLRETVDALKQILLLSPAMHMACNAVALRRVLNARNQHTGLDMLRLVSLHYNIDVCVHTVNVPEGVDPYANLPVIDVQRIRSDRALRTIHLRFSQSLLKGVDGHYDWLAVADEPVVSNLKIGAGFCTTTRFFQRFSEQLLGSVHYTEILLALHHMYENREPAMTLGWIFGIQIPYNGRIYGKGPLVKVTQESVFEFHFIAENVKISMSDLFAALDRAILTPIHRDARNFAQRVDPYANIVQYVDGRLRNRSALKLIEMLVSYPKLSAGRISGKPQGQFTALDLGGAPGGWTVLLRQCEYLVTMVTQRDDRIPVYPDLDAQVIYQSAFDRIEGVYDLVVCDVATDETYSFIKSHEYFCSALQKIENLKLGGSMIIKHHNVLSLIANWHLYVQFGDFQLMDVFKPVFSRPWNTEVYVMLLGRVEQRRVVPVSFDALERYKSAVTMVVPYLNNSHLKHDRIPTDLNLQFLRLWREVKPPIPEENGEITVAEILNGPFVCIEDLYSSDDDSEVSSVCYEELGVDEISLSDDVISRSFDVSESHEVIALPIVVPSEAEIPNDGDDVYSATVQELTNERLQAEHIVQRVENQMKGIQEIVIPERFEISLESDEVVEKNQRRKNKWRRVLNLLTGKSHKYERLRDETVKEQEPPEIEQKVILAEVLDGSPILPVGKLKGVKSKSDIPRFKNEVENLTKSLPMCTYSGHDQIAAACMMLKQPLGDLVHKMLCRFYERNVAYNFLQGNEEVYEFLLFDNAYSEVMTNARYVSWLNTTHAKDETLFLSICERTRLLLRVYRPDLEKDLDDEKVRQQLLTNMNAGYMNREFEDIIQKRSFVRFIIKNVYAFAYLFASSVIGGTDVEISNRAQMMAQNFSINLLLSKNYIDSYDIAELRKKKIKVVKKIDAKYKERKLYYQKSGDYIYEDGLRKRKIGPFTAYTQSELKQTVDSIDEQLKRYLPPDVLYADDIDLKMMNKRDVHSKRQSDGKDLISKVKRDEVKAKGCADTDLHALKNMKVAGFNMRETPLITAAYGNQSTTTVMLIVDSEQSLDQQPFYTYFNESKLRKGYYFKVKTILQKRIRTKTLTDGLFCVVNFEDFVGSVLETITCIILVSSLNNVQADVSTFARDFLVKYPEYARISVYHQEKHAFPAERVLRRSLQSALTLNDKHRYVLFGQIPTFIRESIARVAEKELSRASESVVESMHSAWAKHEYNNQYFRYNPDYKITEDPMQMKRNAMNELREVWRVTDRIIFDNMKRKFSLLPKYFDAPMKAHLRTCPENYGIINNSFSEWIIVPNEEAREYEYCFDGISMLSVAEIKSGKVIPQGAYLMVSKFTALMQDGKLYDAVKHIDVSRAEDTVLKLFNGVPGCGKTWKCLQLFDPDGGNGDLILFPTRESCADFRVRIQAERLKKNLPELTQEQLKANIVTIDSFIINFEKRPPHKRNFEKLLVDEALMVHAGQILFAAFLAKTKNVLLVGDTCQIPYICRTPEVVVRCESALPYINETERMDLSRRCTGTTAMILSSIYTRGTTNDVGMFSVNDIFDEMIVRNYTNVGSVENDKSATYLTFTQGEKKELIKNGFRASTIHEFQGKESDKIVVVRMTSIRNTIYSSESHILVALSRHRREFIYYTPIADDMCVWIKRGMYKSRIIQKKHLKKPDVSVKVYDSRLKRGGAIINRFPQSVNVATCDERIMSCGGNYGSLSPACLPFDTDEHIMDLLTPTFPLIPIATRANDSVAFLQSQYDHVFPGHSSHYVRHDPILVAQSDINLHLEDIRINPDYRGTDKVQPFDKLYPALRTIMPNSRPNSQIETLLALIKRNQAVPKLGGVAHHEALSDRMQNAFLKTYMIDGYEAYLEDFRLHPIVPDPTSIAQWLEKQDPGTVSLIENDRSAAEISLSRYNFMIKPSVKPPMDMGAPYTYASLQTIAFHPKNVNAIFCPIISQLKARIVGLMNPKYKIFTDCSPQEFAKKIHRDIDIDRLVTKFFLEVDISKYDKSQALLVLLYECKLMRTFGVSEDYVQLWFNAHENTTLFDRVNQLKANISYQRKSGDASTFFFNTLFIMAVLAVIFDLDLLDFAAFAGDDSILVGHLKARHDYAQVCADLFNLESKFVYDYERMSFCSKFLLVVDNNVFFVPDPMKMLTKIGRHDLVNFEHVEEYRISLVDLTADFGNALIHHALTEAINDRYNSSGDKGPLISSIYAIVRDSEAFASLFYSLPGDRLWVDPSRPSLG